jgi:hypothetical protein
MGGGKIKVLYISGSGRSGSTILGNILGQFQGFFFVSEIHNIWSYYVLENRLCGCGVPASECQVWKAVLDQVCDNIDQTLAREMDYLREHSVRNRYIPEMLAPWQRSRLKSRLKKYLTHLEKLYRAVQVSTSSEVIVDGSKRPTYGYLLDMIPTIDLYVVHLVRDSRAVAYSWLRKKIQPNMGDEQVYMQQYSPARSAIQWSVQNWATQVFWRHSPQRYLLLRYKDLVDKPQQAIRRILDLVQETPSSWPFVADRVVELGVNHAIWGNPSRFETGLVELRSDDQWQTELGRLDKLAVTALTWPLLWKYGYLGKKDALNYAGQ